MKPELKIIADHLRSSSFLIADGILPSNEGRGYVLRRIMRRAMRQLHKLGAKEVSMYKLVDVLIAEMGDAYPELSRARSVIIETLRNEEEKFRETLGKGLKILEEEMGKITRLGGIGHVSFHDSKQDREKAVLKPVLFSGKVAFKLYDTYGFPLDLTQSIVEEKGFIVDKEEYNNEMEAQRERARKNWVGSGEEKEEKVFFDFKEQFGETKFLGYETLSSKAKVLAVLDDAIILDQTPFYATSGGQKGDDGKIAGIEIFETKKFVGDLFVHFFAKQNCDLKAGDEVLAEVNQEGRAARGANHSATHLMHKALKQVLGDSISQKGSNVDAKYFTFDFNFNRAMTAQEIQEVETLVNAWIAEKSAVSTNLMDLEKARETGAEALFGEKYDAEVRVVKMGPSVELCGGTHVENTSEIEIFKIISEKSTASGIRRIEARTGNEVRIYLNELNEEKLKKIAEIRQKIDKKNQEIFELTNSQPDDSHKNEADSKTLEEILKKKDKEIDRLKKEALLSNLDDLKAEKIGEVNLIAKLFDGSEAKDLREIVTSLKGKKDLEKSSIFALFGHKDGKVSICVAVSADLTDKFDSSSLIKPLVEAVGGKGGGGKKDLAMGGGNDKEAVPQAIKTLRDLLS